MKTPIILSTFIFILLAIISSCSLSAAADNDDHEDFLECLSERYHNSISNVTYTPNNSSYASILRFSIQNLRFTSQSTPRPQVIITPEHESQIPRVIHCARENDMEIRIRSGGHDYEGLSYVSQVPFVILDLINFSEITVDPEAKTAWVGSGATIGSLNNFDRLVRVKTAVDPDNFFRNEQSIPQTHHIMKSPIILSTFISILLVITISSCSSTDDHEDFLECLTERYHNSISNVTYTPNNSSYTSILRFSIHNLRFASQSTPRPQVIITPEHESQVPLVVHCARENDMEIRIRSGGHDYEGLSYVSQVPFVILDLINLSEISVDPESKTAWNATQLVHRWQSIAHMIDPDLFVMILITRGNSARNGRNNNFTIRVTFNSTFLGGADRLISIMDQNFPELGLTREDCVEMSWIDSVLYFAGSPNEPREVLLNRTQPFVRYFKAKSDLVQRPIPEQGLEGMWRLFYEPESEEALVIMVPFGGVMDNISESDISFPHRAGNMYIMQYYTYWREDNARNSDRYISWIRRLYSYMAPYVSSSPRAAYVNCRDVDIGDNNNEGRIGYARASIWGRKYFGNNFDRLVRVKTASPNLATLLIFTIGTIFSCSLTATADHDDFLECLIEKNRDNSISNVTYTPNNSSYASILRFSIQNLRFTSQSTPRPQVIITPEHESQIPAIIQCARANDLQIRTRSGGHDYEGLSYVSRTPFVIVDLINLGEITIDTQEKTAWNATQLVHRWQSIASTFDRDLLVRVFVRRANSTRAGRDFTIRASFTATFLGGAERLVSVLRRSFPELGLTREDCVEMSWIESVLYSAGLPIQPREALLDRAQPSFMWYFKAKSDYVTRPIPKGGLEGLWRLLYEPEAEQGEILMTPYGGVMDEILETEVPFPHRAGNLYSLHYQVRWPENENRNPERYLAWIRRLYSYMAPYVSSFPRAAYVNYRDLDIGVNGDEGQGSYARASVWGRKYFKNNFDRLVRVKTAVDPENFFRNEQTYADTDHEVFLKCLEDFHDSISNVTYTQNNSSYSSILRFSIQNLRFTSQSTPRPQVIITPQHESQVPPVIHCAKKNDIEIRTRSAGHDYEGLSYVSQNPNFIILDLINLSEVTIDPEKKTAWSVANAIDRDLFIRVFVERMSVRKNFTIRASFNSVFFGGVERLIPMMQEKFSELGLTREDCTEMSWIESVLYFAGIPIESRKALLDRAQPEVRYFKGKSDYVWRPVSKQGIEGLLRLFYEPEGEKASIIMVPYGGAMDEFSESWTPFPHRAGNLYSLHYAVYWEEHDSENADQYIDWITRLYDYMAPYVSSSPRRAYVNYRDLDIGRNGGESSYARASVWGRKYFDRNFDRLVRVKTEVEEPISESGIEGMLELLKEWEAGMAEILIVPYGGRMKEIQESALLFPHRAEICTKYNWRIGQGTGRGNREVDELGEEITPYASSFQERLKSPSRIWIWK
ncbi:FAD-binding Berberine family protein [Striga asiatica]|uniref:FAD-binding Berberine family protein n=1 Tax=Striga asiatica TaxID=4170 RepID=A0A5A7PVA4_STRAF|nr:FAD-binding Berberine family protein [Striga asiatica]